MSRQGDRHNRLLNLLKALQNLRMDDITDIEIVKKCHHLLYQIQRYDQKIAQGEDMHGLTQPEAHMVMRNDIVQAVKAMNKRTRLNLAECRSKIENHPAFAQAKVIQELERDDTTPF